MVMLAIIGQRARLGRFVAFAVVRLYAVVAGIGRLIDHQILDAALPAVGPVQGIVGVAGKHHVGRVHRAAEELHAVVEVVVDLDEVTSVPSPTPWKAMPLSWFSDPRWSRPYFTTT